MPFFTYDQNNSGGSFSYVEGKISHHVIIEADDASDADERAEGLGLYFGGESDCACCGDRWYPKADWSWTDEDGEEFPSVYGRPVSAGEVLPAANTPEGELYYTWMGEGKAEGFIHYKDGRVEDFWRHREPNVVIDGQFGWGVQFNSHGAQAFEVCHNGYDESGNLGQVPSGTPPDEFDSEFHIGGWQPPAEATFKVDTQYGYGFAWFPTQEEAEEFATAYKKYRVEVRKAIRKVPRPDGFPKEIAKVFAQG